jgi:hypothetical protein
VVVPISAFHYLVESESQVVARFLDRGRRDGLIPQRWARIMTLVPKAREELEGPEVLLARWWPSAAGGTCGRPDTAVSIRAVTELPDEMEHESFGPLNHVPLRYLDSRLEIRGGPSLEDLRGGCMEVEIAWSRSALRARPPGWSHDHRLANQVLWAWNGRLDFDFGNGRRLEAYLEPIVSSDSLPHATNAVILTPLALTRWVGRLPHHWPWEARR